MEGLQSVRLNDKGLSVWCQWAALHVLLNNKVSVAWPKEQFLKLPDQADRLGLEPGKVLEENGRKSSCDPTAMHTDILKRVTWSLC